MSSERVDERHDARAARLGLEPLRARARQKSLLFWLAIVGVYCTFVLHLFSAIFPSGNRFMPFASQGKVGTDWQEALVFLGVAIIGSTLIPVSWLAAWGLWRHKQD